MQKADNRVPLKRIRASFSAPAVPYPKFAPRIAAFAGSVLQFRHFHRPSSVCPKAQGSSSDAKPAAFKGDLDVGIISKHRFAFGCLDFS